MPELHYYILPAEQRALWDSLRTHAGFLDQHGYYLAGGTALALHLGHRQSVDFDFFSQQPSLGSDTLAWVERLPAWTLRDRDADTVHGDLGGVKVSFIGKYRYPLVEEPVRADGVSLASVTDIGLMKLLAITHRGVLRDYIDLAAIVRTTPLRILLQSVPKKYGNSLDTLLFLRALSSFQDLEPEVPQVFDTDLLSTWQAILLREVRDVARS